MITENDYTPLKFLLGPKHPNPLIEKASLASVTPPDVTYKLRLPDEIIRRGFLSSPQLEALVYSSQVHQEILPNGTRAGFLIGDGPGVGKGRTIAGIILENYLHGRKKAIWLSSSTVLKCDAVRDLCDIGAGNIAVHTLKKMKSEVEISLQKGVIFSSYSTLNGTSLIRGKCRTRLEQLLEWCGQDFDGVIVFDETRNLVSIGSSKLTKTGRAVLMLQEKLPQARIVYISGVGVSDPLNMMHMIRLGLWDREKFKGMQMPVFYIEK